MGDKKSTPKSASKVASKVNGGWVNREAVSGRFVEVVSERGTSRAKPDSEAVIEQASKDRYDALKRLANR